jgi:hypothetical protein
MLMMAKAGKRDGYLLGHGLPRRLRGRRRHRHPGEGERRQCGEVQAAGAAVSSTESPFLGRLKEVEE